jgi:hypothetical protein
MMMKLTEVDALGGHKLPVRVQRSGDQSRPLEIKTRKTKDIVASAGTVGYVAYISGAQTLSLTK